MKRILFYTLLIAICFGSCAVNHEKNLEDKERVKLKNTINTQKVMIYKNSEIEIRFPGSYKEVEKGHFWSEINKSYVKGYFFELEKEISFHEDDQEKFYTAENGEIIETQHVITSNGYLSTLYIYPAIEKASLLAEIEKAFKPENLSVSYRKVNEVKFGDLKVLNWRTQNKKNRFEYYLVLGKIHNYLFISTPYGEQEYIENVLHNIKLSK